MPNDKRGQSVIPLGTFCMVAQMLKTYGMRDASLPFDWLFCPVSSVAAILRDDFAHFLNPSYLLSTLDENGGPRCMHALYDGLSQERPTFAHRDPNRQEDRDYYTRCVARFRSAARSGATLLLIEEFGEIEREFDTLCEALAFWPACRLIAVRHEQGSRALSLVRERGEHRLFHYRASPVMAGVRLAEPSDEIWLLQELFPGQTIARAQPLATPARRGPSLLSRLFATRRG